jgi:hypothetical protein
MVRINDVKDIDKRKLDDLFKKRGHGVISPDFQQKILDILETRGSPLEVYQCDCGELFWMPKEHAQQLIEKYGTENIPCFKCQGVTEGKLSFLIFKKIVDICERLQEYEGGDQLDEIQKNALLTQIISESKGIIPTASLDEMYLGLRDVIDNIKSELSGRNFLPTGKYSPLDQIFEDSIKACPDIFDKLTTVSKINELRAASRNSDLAYSSIKSATESIVSLKFSGLSINDYLPDYSKDKSVEIEINRKMALHKNRFEEGRYYLDLLLNLIHAIEGLPIEVNPFDKHTLPTKKGKGKAIRGMADRIELFKHLSHGVPLYPLLKDAYDNKLRNDDGHNQYRINTRKRTIHSLKYKREISFEELDQKIDELTSLHGYIGKFWRDYYPLTKHQYVKNMGIEELLFSYEDSFVTDGFLIPLGSALPVLGIIQYWDFAQYKDGSRYIPMPNIFIDNGTVMVSFENGSTITRELDDSMEFWLSRIISCNKFKIRLTTIAPLLPWFNENSMFSMPINNLPEVNIMQQDEIDVDLSESIKVQIVSAIGLGV